VAVSPEFQKRRAAQVAAARKRLKTRNIRRQAEQQQREPARREALARAQPSGAPAGYNLADFIGHAQQRAPRVNYAQAAQPRQRAGDQYGQQRAMYEPPRRSLGGYQTGYGRQYMNQNLIREPRAAALAYGGRPREYQMGQGRGMGFTPHGGQEYQMGMTQVPEWAQARMQGMGYGYRAPVAMNQYQALTRPVWGGRSMVQQPWGGWQGQARRPQWNIRYYRG
jgi:hypothetical protein